MMIMPSSSSYNGDDDTHCPFRRYGFLFGCLPVRALLVYVAYRYWHVPVLMPILGVFALVVSTSFFALFALNLRLTGREVCHGRIWWNKLRPVHGILYLSFAAMVFLNMPAYACSSSLDLRRYAYVPLFADFLIGASAHFSRFV